MYVSACVYLTIRLTMYTNNCQFVNCIISELRTPNHNWKLDLNWPISLGSELLKDRSPICGWPAGTYIFSSYVQFTRHNLMLWWEVTSFCLPITDHLHHKFAIYVSKIEADSTHCLSRRQSSLLHDTSIKSSCAALEATHLYSIHNCHRIEVQGHRMRLTMY